MDDPILMSRLEALQTNLSAVSANLRNTVWQLDPGSADATGRTEFFGESDLWLVLQDRSRAIELCRQELVTLKDELEQAPAGDAASLAEHWSRYTVILNDCRNLLREGLEVIGTLAIRHKQLDGCALSVADELIKESLMLCISEQNYYFLVQGQGETMSRTKARIIRLRFPEWSIWDLPLAVYELGHNVVIAAVLVAEREEEERRQYLTRLLGDWRDDLLKRDEALRKTQDSADEAANQARRWAELRARALIADAFATYTLGPAYAYSAIRLRFSPSATASREVPSDAQRAQVVLSMLEWLNEQDPLKKPYADALESLGTEWRAALGCDGSKCVLPDEEAIALRGFARRFATEVGGRSLNPTAMYPSRALDQGWARAQAWADDWDQQWAGQNVDLRAPESPSGKLRDVLNATWLFRRIADLKYPKDRHIHHPRIAKAGQQLCETIMQARRASRQAPTSHVVSPGVIR